MNSAREEMKRNTYLIALNDLAVGVLDHVDHEGLESDDQHRALLHHLAAHHLKH